MSVAILFAAGVGVFVVSSTGLAIASAARRREAERRVVTHLYSAQLEEEVTPAKTTEPAEPELEKDELGPLGRLPPFGPVVVRLLHLCDRDVEVAEVARLVESDPVVACEILALVNSPLFGVCGTVSTAGHAVTMLGVDRTRALATSLAVRFMTQNIPDRNMVRRVWRHSLATAVLAQRLAPVFQVDENMAHTAAMLHDLGRLGLLAAHRGAYVQLATKSYETVNDIITAEEAQFGMSHCQAGRVIGRAWGFPETLQTVIAHHHETPALRDMLSLVQISCELADSLTFESIHRWDVGKPAAVIEARALPECRDGILAALDGIENAIVAHAEALDF
jgi:putative nucleotidyltransferase with HDIG domain